MTNFVAIYLLVTIGIILTTIAFWRKHWFLFIPCALAWAVSGIYCITISMTPGNEFVYAFGYFCIAMFFIMAIAPLAIRRNPTVPPEVENKSDDDAYFEELLKAEEENSRYKRAIGR